VVLFGTDECLGILKVNEQLRRRFRVRLEPYDWRIKESRQAFRRLLKELDLASKLKYSGLSAADTALLIYQAASGLIGYIMDLVREAIYIAQRDNAPHITHDVLSVAFARGRRLDS